MKKWLHKYRFELLLIALIIFIFDKILFFNDNLYNAFVWPINMVLLGVVSVGIFHENNTWVVWLKNILFVIVIIIPFIQKIIFSSSFLSFFGLFAYISFYIIIFIETIKQVIKQKAVSESVIMGSLSGFLLITIIATFSFLLLNLFDSSTFNNLIGSEVPKLYQQITYFSIITLTTIGYGDITPATDNARLLAGFWGVIGQFYMVAVVGIIISKFTSDRK
jgi:hypothetical protein